MKKMTALRLFCHPNADLFTLMDITNSMTLFRVLGLTGPRECHQLSDLLGTTVDRRHLFERRPGPAPLDFGPKTIH